ncbi:MAG: malto-oligosyltrehalose trehalohydrolase [Gammaproteobacteria bacterium]
MQSNRRFSFGADIVPGGVRFRLYAPALDEAAVVLGTDDRIAMARSPEGFFEATITAARAGTRYRYEIATGVTVPDPASRFQPEDVDGPSEVLDLSAWEWNDNAWRGRPWNEAVVYELHVGCFSGSGDYAGIEQHLDHLERLGVTAIELMPVSDFAGARNWGYDGVLPYAPDSAYGRPEDLKRLIDTCHARGFMVLLDVVYNHFGPSGNYLARYAPDFFHADAHTPWGAALAFDNPVLRAFFIENALYWLEDYRFDGLRFDAVHAIEEASGGADFLRELAEGVRRKIRGREVHLVLENDRNEAHWLPHEESPSNSPFRAVRARGRTEGESSSSALPLGCEAAKGEPEGDSSAQLTCYTAQWNDDFHHAAHVAATEESDGYYADYAEHPARHLARALAEGFAYQGERSKFRDGACRGEPSTGVWPAAFVNFLQNHDQAGNRAFGKRLSELAARELLHSLYALMILSPGVPLLFMGEEWAASTPFQFFCDFSGELGDAVRKGRRNEFARFAAFREPAEHTDIPDPISPATFERSRLDWKEADAGEHARWLEFIAGLLTCRRRELVPRLPQITSGIWEMLGETAFSIEWPLADGGHWRLAANLGDETTAAPSLPGRLVYADPADDAATFAANAIVVTCDEQ